MTQTDQISARQTRERLREDRARLKAFLATRPDLTSGALWLLPSYQAAYLHRWSHYFFAAGIGFSRAFCGISI